MPGTFDQIIEIQHANPFYDDSYAVNSANLGPYGDAITHELIPYVEKTFRGIGEGWARFLYGGSTGSWEALAAQVFYPDERMEDFLESTAGPHYDGIVDYGDRAEHCWNGDHENGNHISRLRYNTMYGPRILERIEESAPAGADLTSWRY